MLQMTLEMPNETAAITTLVDSDEGTPLGGKARAVFEAMRAIVESPGCILTDYKVDFYKYDRDQLASVHGIGPFIWIVREMGTHLIRVGVHTRAAEEVDAVLDVGDRKLDIYLIDTDKVAIRKISATLARDAAHKLAYRTKNGTVSVGDRALAWLDVQITPWRDGKSPQGIVKVTPLVSHLTKADLLALRQIGASEVVALSQSLFTGMQSCTVNGIEIHGLINHAE